ncbi:hypothetical protein BDN72DRAFT_851584 [Pluteus cervinus]|uniref:Uncharacterized protein n=1 Tax=Pluteus cervinus TaxID=181527 RepID=A0ACD3A083_9AGAR|nr:hypothetical protein BDN72DRAFT_851584 [Pluteus cervinus]
MVSVLWAVTLNKATGPDGREITPDTSKFIDDGLVVRPEQFPCIIKPRGGEVAQTLNIEREKAIN